jgi:hypothetical protein
LKTQPFRLSARVSWPPEVEQIHTAPGSITADEFRGRFNPQLIMKEQISPEIWDRDPRRMIVPGFVKRPYESFVAPATKDSYGSRIPKTAVRPQEQTKQCLARINVRPRFSLQMLSPSDAFPFEYQKATQRNPLDESLSKIYPPPEPLF